MFAFFGGGVRLTKPKRHATQMTIIQDMYKRGHKVCFVVCATRRHIIGDGVPNTLRHSVRLRKES